MDTVTSTDGTPICFYCRGLGAPLILIPGTGAANPVAWTAVLPTLEAHFRVYALDRRGHGASGDTPSYAIEREYEDIVAVIDSCAEPAHVLGHSFGGLLALEAALRTRNVRSLIVYEPALDGSLYPEGFLDHLEAFLKTGDRESALTIYYRELVGMQPDEIEQFRSSAAWPDRVATAHTLPREMRAEERYRFDPQRFEQLNIPTLLLQGGDSPVELKAGTERLKGSLPNWHLAVLPGQQHLAMYTAADLFLREVLGFLTELQ